MNQMLFVIGAIVLLGVASLGVNYMLLSKTTTMLQAEASLTAISMAQTMIDEVMSQSFDEVTANGTLIYDSTKFTPQNQLGPSSTESSHVPLPDTASPFNSIQYYNDVGDYNNYSRISSTPLLGQFTIVDTILYVQESDPDSLSTGQTFFKKILVTVRHPNMTYPVQLSDVVVYRKYF
jgi:hypothetical protein